MWCGDVVITGVKWQISRHTAGDITLVAVEDPLIRSFHLAAQHMSGLWGTKHYCWQSCIKRWCLILHILHTEAATIARKSLESVNWSLEMEHSCMLDPSRCPAAHHSSQCVAMFKWSPSSSSRPSPTHNPIFQTTEKTSSAAARHFTHISTKLPDR